MSKLIREIECKMHDKEEAYAVIGAEIRLRRLSSYKTLKALAYKTCSVSYISKIESNDIIPNQFVFRELLRLL